MPDRPILTAEEMRAAETAVIDAGTPVETLMERAGAGAAEAIWRYAGPRPTLVICGPGNNGGDGYVIARCLRDRGSDVRVAALAEPRNEAARWARSLWTGPIEALADTDSAAVLVDALFGTGLSRPLTEGASGALHRLAGEADIKVAVDLPSGAATDDGRLLSPVPDFDLTVTFATLKPSHLLQPAARHMGRIVVADIGIVADSRLREIGRPALAAPGPDDHKYRRGYVIVVPGTMPGAAALTAAASIKAGAGYVRMIGTETIATVPKAIIQGDGSLELLADHRVGAVVIGPGLGRGKESLKLLEAALASGRPLVLDADALALLADRRTLIAKASGAILTPHAGEFTRLFGAPGGSKLDQARAAAADSGSVVVYKGADTVVAAPDGTAAIAPRSSPWLATAGTGDVLAGIIAAMRARGLDPFDAACAGVWLHGRAADQAGPGLIADDLIAELPGLIAICLGPDLPSAMARTERILVRSKERGGSNEELL